MFNIDIGTVLNDNRYLNKDFNIKMTNVEGVLRDECDVINPIITVNYKVDALSSCNYVKIGKFNRYYYITNMIGKTSTLTELHLKCDVLMSNPTITNCTCTIDRQENRYDAYLDDERVITKYPPAVSTIPFNTLNDFSGNAYILVTSGGFEED